MKMWFALFMKLVQCDDWRVLSFDFPPSKGVIIHFHRLLSTTNDDAPIGICSALRKLPLETNTIMEKFLNLFIINRFDHIAPRSNFP